MTNYHPILFKGPMVRAIIEGHKTQTRRVIRQQPPWWVSKITSWTRDGSKWQGLVSDAFWSMRCPYGVPGDHLYVRETWAYWGSKEEPNPLIVYRADEDKVLRWRPSIHMPKRFTRLWLTVTGIRLERVQDITEEDAIAEGTRATSIGDFPRQAVWTERQDFANLWDSINAKRGYPWEDNPWVWVIEFEKETQHDQQT